jgi:Tol biopolymer transport system component
LVSLQPGTRLGAYDIVALVGSGGMGEVYRARDTRLKREVAIKVLPDVFANDPDRLARFQREAELLATLNHPNIAQIHGVEERALVLELVDGPTLADRIAQGPILLDEALPIARQIAEALEAAHERGIIHRDLKPANIKLTADGNVKVLDFGLAKAMETSDAGRNFPGSPKPYGEGGSSAAAESRERDPAYALSHSPTITSPAMATHAGVILGTAAYMSPEQARGKPVDRRTDIWSFGCVLFELLTGQRAFGGNEVTDTLAFIITRDPDWSALPSATPESMRRLLRRCLQKDRRQRLPDIGVARLEIDEPAHASVAVAGPGSSPAPGAHRGTVALWVAGTAVVVAALTAGTAHFLGSGRSEPANPVVRFTFEPGRVVNSTTLAIPPDGQTIACVVGQQSGRNIVAVRPLNSPETRELPGTEGAVYPFWSPDSQTLGFFADGKLKRIALAGGPAQVLADAPAPRGGTWHDQGIIVFSSEARLYRVDARGGQAATALNDTVKTSDADGWPQFVSGDRFIYLKMTPEENRAGLYAAALGSTQEKLVVSTSSAASYAGGHLFFVRDRSVVAQSYNPITAELSGNARPIAQSVAINQNFFSAAFSASESILAYVAGELLGAGELVWFDRSGREIAKSGEPAAWGSLNLSHDEKHLALVRSDAGATDIWTLDVDRNIPARVTSNGLGNGDANFSADDQTIYFSTLRRGRPEIFRKSAGGIGNEDLVAESGRLSDVSIDGKLLLQLRQGLTAISISDQKATSFLPATASGDQARFSPNNRWVAFNRSETGRAEVFVVSYPAADQRWQVSTGGGVQPRWRRDGRELFYLALDGTLMSVEVEEADGLRFTRPRPLFQTGARARTITEEFDVTADGQRFVAIRPLAADQESPVHVTTNWLSWLEGRTQP